MTAEWVFVYDRTWDGLLTAVFDAYVRRQFPVALLGEADTPPLFVEVHHVVSDVGKAGRVGGALQRKLSPAAMACLSGSLYAELPALDLHLFRYVCKALEAAGSIEANYADPDVRFVTDTYRKVLRERLRMMQFVRFQKTADGTCFAMMEPDFDVLPLVEPHFADRFCRRAVADFRPPPPLWLLLRRPPCGARRIRKGRGYFPSSGRAAGRGRARRGRGDVPRVVAHVFQGHLHRGTPEPAQAPEGPPCALLEISDGEAAGRRDIKKMEGGGHGQASSPLPSEKREKSVCVWLGGDFSHCVECLNRFLSCFFVASALGGLFGVFLFRGHGVVHFRAGN